MSKELSTYEAHVKYGPTPSYIRRLAVSGKIKAREIYTAPKRKIWLVDENSLKKYLKKDHRRKQ